MSRPQRAASRWLAAPRRRAALICAGTFSLLAVWIFIFPYTGDGDSILHFWAASEAWVNPSAALSPWARPLHKLLILLPALGGLVPARLVQAGLTVALMWQTMCFARDLKFPRPELAGLFVIWQPYVFFLAADTMTEIPFALGALVALRLLQKERIAWSCLLVGFLPLVRPEGFFLGVLWAMLLGVRALGAFRLPAPQRARHLLRTAAASMLGGAGMSAWVAACWIFTGDPRYFLTAWSWPANSYPYYPSGSLLYHVYMWPEYCGIVLTPLFLFGIFPAARRKGMGLGWALWLTVFVVHSILFWGHWFASFGLMRIMATISPITALVCYEGWLALDRRLLHHRFQRPARFRIAWTIGMAAWAFVLLRYWLESDHHRCLSIRPIAQYAIEHNLLRTAPRVFAADKIFYVEVSEPPLSPRAIANFTVDPQNTLHQLASLPSGSIGMWDNQVSQIWYNVKIDQLQALGYEILQERTHELPRLSAWAIEFMGFKYEPHRYVLLRKR